MYVLVPIASGTVPIWPSPAEGSEGLHVHTAAQSLGAGVHVLKLAAVAREASVGLYRHVTWTRAPHANRCNTQRKQ